MSYDLYFWKQTIECGAKPSEVLDALSQKQAIKGVESIPIGEILSRLRIEFPEIYENHTANPEAPVQLIWDSSDDDSVFLVSWSERHLCIEGHGVDGEVYNRIIDLMFTYDCRLYDPQTDTRYTG